MEVMRTEYFAVDVCGWKPNCSLTLEVAALCMAQLPTVCLTSSMGISGDLPWSWQGCPQDTGAVEPPALGVWGAAEGTGLGIPSSSGSCSQTWFHGLGDSQKLC